ncbi:hypothetical protein EVJ58_g8829 [Rhodofomes roseus]|uniref:Reverse transcriptase domain-containing protein n=1 Tax=Rhodofomes roseus TaxID=34475 RepID=A0A4Y9XXI7_9APHY|nr:hypothetical protein EVJ58_g8829 [Rhodofomes roseus]
MTTSIHWHKEENLTILNVYAPNDATANSAFWPMIEEYYANPRHKLPDILIGDFNAIEESIDRLPPREDPTSTIEPLQRLLTRLRMKDGWRITNPTQCDYTFPQRASEVRSRLDRIYVTGRLLQSSQVWRIQSTGIPTDHRLASALLSTKNAPYIGKGRWTLPLALLQDKSFMAEIKAIGNSAFKDIIEIKECGTRSPHRNAQTIHKAFKDRTITLARTLMKKKAPKLTAAIKKLTVSIDSIQADPAYNSTTRLQTEAEVLLDRVIELERKRYQHVREATVARYALNAETLSKYWSNINKDKNPRDVIYALKKPGTHEYVRRSSEMAELARHYHNALQNSDAEHEDYTTRKSAIRPAINNIQQFLSDRDSEVLQSRISEADIRDALKKAQAGKASGLDGIPYEFWKALQDDESDNDSSFNSNAYLQNVLDDIDSHGVDQTCGFADGWMCPIYKKMDKRDISNYRPITVLNTDYKLYTRIMATKLGSVVKTIIHPNQAGFIPGRQISDQTQLCRTMVDYAEATDDNGVIVALDQEKAYDRIKHDYLWDILRAMGLPESFITRIKNLYENATTVIIINGEISKPYRVSRGVRQGDPLSCLLFDLAIEPLACALRRSNLRGFQIPGLTERVITSLFADDTSTFLAQCDRWSDLWLILDSWCSASGARFNSGKTEVIPIGSPEYRAQVIQTRRIDPTCNAPSIPDFVHIARDGEAVRILGAWIGNRTREAAIWTPTLEKVDRFLTRWGRCNPTMKGKKHIIQMGPGGMTQYLTTVQGMPASIEKELTKKIRSFIWGDNGSPLVNLDTLHSPISAGGLDILDIYARNEAIELTWLRKYLTLSDSRPDWAFVVDILIAMQVSRSAGAIQSSAQINSFLQNWNPAMHAASTLPHYIKRMLKTAKKHQTSFGAIKLSTELKGKLPIWYHISASPLLRRLDNTSLSKCLRKNHGVIYTADVMMLARHDFIPTPLPSDTLECTCDSCQTAVNNGCRNPLSCVEAARRLLTSLSDKWNPQAIPIPDGLTLTQRRDESNCAAFKTKDGEAIFNPSITEHGGVSEVFRVFMTDNNLANPPNLRPRRGVTFQRIAVYILEARCAFKHGERRTAPEGSGIFLFKRNQETAAQLLHPLANIEDLTTSGEITAASYTVQRVPKDVPIEFICETQFLRDVLCKDLQRWEDSDWLGMSNKLALQDLINVLRQRCAPTSFRKARTNEDWAIIDNGRHLVKYLLDNNGIKTVSLTTDPTLHLSGARLSCLSQRTAYRLIMQRRPIETRRSTALTVEAVLAKLNLTSENTITTNDLWRSLRNPDFRRPVSDFLWKSLHSAFRVGRFWAKISGYEDRAMCQYCGVVDSMTHILLECTAPGQIDIWTMAGNLWRRKQAVWTKPDLEDILSVGMRCWFSGNGKKKRRPFIERMWRILISEATYLIWCLRCERTIGHALDDNWTHSRQEIRARWGRVLNSRLHLDIAMTHRRFGRSALWPNLVLSTWCGTLHDEAALPDDWTKIRRVLVGIDPTTYVTWDVG